MAYRKIHNKGEYRQEEFVAKVAGIYPGMLIMENSAGGVILHDTDGGYAEAMFAAEDALQGEVVGDVYTNATKVTTILPAKGSVVNALIPIDEDIAIGEYLISNGLGGLIAEDQASGTVQQIIAVAEEAVDLTVSSAVATLIAVRIV